MVVTCTEKMELIFRQGNTLVASMQESRQARRRVSGHLGIADDGVPDSEQCVLNLTYLSNLGISMPCADRLVFPLISSG